MLFRSYSNEWELLTLQDDENNDLYFPLSKGTHTIRMEITLGDLGNILNQIEESIFRLNQIYRKILILTGPIKWANISILNTTTYNLLP